MEQLITSKLHDLNATYIAPIKVETISFDPSLRSLCEMNSCGCYNTNWGCPPHSGEVNDLIEMVKQHKNGIVYQYVGNLEDSLDLEGMEAAASVFFKITDQIRIFANETIPNSFVLGAGGCYLCGENCTFPDAPCRFPKRKNISVEACGINASSMCKQCGLKYINGQNTVTYTGIVLY